MDTCSFIPQDKANLSHGPTKLMLHNQQSVMVGKGEGLVGHCVAQIKFEPFFGLATGCYV